MMNGFLGITTTPGSLVTCNKEMMKMRIRLVLDNHSPLHDWYRVEEWKGERWQLIDSGLAASMRQLFEKCKRGVPAYTVMDEWTDEVLSPRADPEEVTE